MKKLHQLNFDKLLWPIFFPLLCLLYIFFLTHPINLAFEDLGRHIMNGQQLLSGNFQVLTQNTYSYSQPEQQFINHHWLSGVIFFLLNKVGGIKLVVIFHQIILLGGLFFLIRSLNLIAGKKIALLLGLITVLLLSSRVIVRPESFGLLLLCHTLWQLLKIAKDKKIHKKQIILLVLQQLIWINLHISFIFGIYLLTVFTLCAVFLKQQKFSLKVKQNLIYCLLISILVSLLNPHGLKGLLIPLTIFKDYGYSIVENQTLTFLLNWGIRFPEMNLYFLTAPLILILMMISFNKSPHFLKILASTGIILAWTALRNMPIFTVFSIPLLAWSIQFYVKKISKKLTIDNWQKNFFILTSISYFFIFVFVLSGSYYAKFSLKNRKLGLVDNQFTASNFFKILNIKGNIFNNYDIGSYLIYTLYPQQKVFVDNRPEAYSYEFLQDIYIPMQTDDQIWQKMLDKYNFEAIFWGHRDLTEWGQAFYHKRLADPEWEVAYQDDFAIIFLRKTDHNL